MVTFWNIDPEIIGTYTDMRRIVENAKVLLWTLLHWTS